MRLFLCEKPSQGRDIAAVLGATKRHQGFLSGPGVTVTWAIGHLLETAAPEAYGEQFGRPWRLEALPVLPENWQMTVKKETADQFTVISRLLRQVDEVVIATDADREGEMIGRELLEYCAWQGPVWRLWLSALDNASIRAALSALKPGEETQHLYYAGLGRSRADWLIGMNLSRLYTLKARDIGFDGVLSVGRVQTPTLALVVRRDREIAHFIPKPYWQVMAMLQAADGMTFPTHWVPADMYTDEEKRCVHENIAHQVAGLCRQAGNAQVVACETKREKASAPLAFSLGTLQQACAKRWDMSPQQVLDIAQNLYETHKVTTYPRTDCGYLPRSMRAEIPVVLTAIVKTDPAIQPVVESLDRAFVSRIWNDKKITAHHGIIPTRNPCDLSRMSEVERQVYHLIRQHYLAQFLPLHETDVTKLTLNIGGQLFRTSGRVTLIPGWKVLFQTEATQEKAASDGEEKDITLPLLQKGDTCRVREVRVNALMTQPPAHYTFDSLIAAMMNAVAFVTDLTLRKVLKASVGLGTEATRSGVIEQLLAREFIVRKGRQLRATDIASDLIDTLPVQLTEPGMTALWEQALDEVAAGRLPLADFLSRQVQWTRQLVSQGISQTVSLRVPPTPPCPLCGGRTRLRRGEKGGFYGCIGYPNCKGIVNVPGSKPSAKKRRKRPS